MTSNEMPVPAVMNVVSQDVEANYINSPVVVYLDVETGSSGGMADWCLSTR
jgi:carbamoylphosphate synthase large subunit